MFTDKKLDIATIVYIFVNLLFVTKYSYRIVGLWCIAMAVVLCALYVLCFKYAVPFILKKQNWYKFVFAFLICVMCLELCLQYYVNPYSINVDRWSALYFPIQNLLNGTYPYGAHTHLGGYASPFPVWLVVHIPFYLCGNVGLSFFAFLAFFLFSVYKIQGKEYSLLCFFLIAISPAILYEVLVRSDLIGNILLMVALINIVVNKINENWFEKYYLVVACIFGLLMSTRLVCIIPVGMLLFPFFFKIDKGKQLLFVFMSVLVFVLTFVPFVLMDWDSFWHFKFSPWMLQTRQGNISDFILFIPLFIYLSLKWNKQEVLYYRNVAIMLFAFVGITFLHNMCTSGQFDLFSGAYDITYFTMSVPFCILSIALQQTLNCKRLD